MKTHRLSIAIAVVTLLATLVPLSAREARAQTAFQAAGPTAESILGTVNAYRAALGEDRGSATQSFPDGRREINWDGGGANDTTTAPVTPFDTFLNIRGALFTTPGDGLSQAPPSGGPQGGLATLFGNPSYGNIFKTFSAPRLFTPVGSRITEAQFFVPGTTGGTAAVVAGFGAVFTDVDKPGGVREGHSTVIDYFDADDNLIFTGLVPSSPGDGHFSFFGVVFAEPVIARVRIKTGDVRPGRDDGRQDIVMMDDFIYGEPQPIVPVP